MSVPVLEDEDVVFFEADRSRSPTWTIPTLNRPKPGLEFGTMSKTVTASIVIAGFFLVGALLFAINGNLSVSDVAH